MSNELDIFANEKPLAAFAGDSGMDLGAGVTNSYPVLGYRGKVWSLRHSGTSSMFLRPDDGTPAPFIDVVILRAPETKSKSYYDGYVEGETGKRPICASIDGVRPDNDVVEKQAEVCALCPRNQWYTNDKGKKTQDCSDFKRLAVLLLQVIPGSNPPQFRPYEENGEALVEPTFLRVPGGSLRDLKAFGDDKPAQWRNPMSYITRISFAVNESYPKFVYKAVAPVRDPELAKLILALHDDPVAKRITGEEMVGQGSMRTIDTPVSQPEHPTTRAGTETRQNPRVAEPANTAAPPRGVQVLELTSQKDGSYGDPSLVGGSSPPGSARPANDNAVHAVGQTAADVGTSVDDPAMEALLAGLMEVDS